MKYRFLEDIATADVAFEAFGKNEKELFQNCGGALTEVMADVKTIKPICNFEFSILNKKLEGLLFDFLSELVFLKDTKQLIFSKFELKIKTLHSRSYTLVAKLWGEKINSQKHKLRTDVKAVTWHLFKVEKVKNDWRAQVVLDI